jgi:tetratricopeptide (TPR) repeat protein
MKQLLLSVCGMLLFSSLTFSQADVNIDNGLVKRKSGNHNGAIYDFGLSIKEHSTETQKYLTALEEYNKVPDFEKAEKGLEAPQVDAKLANAYLLRGQSYSNMGKNDDAMNDFNTAVKIDSKMGAAYYERGRILWTTGKKDEGCIELGIAASLKDSLAKEAFDEKFCWKEAVANSSEAASKLRLNDYQGALDKIGPAIRLCPDSARYLGIRGRALFGLGKTDLAMKDFDKAIAMNQNSLDAYLGRGMAHYLKNKHSEACADLSKVIDMDNKQVDAYLYRAYACEGMDKNTSALFDYQQVQRLKPGDAMPFMKSASLRGAMNDPKGACNDYKRAAALGNSEAIDLYEKCSKVKK